MVVFRVVAVCNKAIDSMMKGRDNSEILVIVYRTTRHDNEDGSHVLYSG